MDFIYIWGYTALGYNFIFVTYSFYKLYSQKQPLTFLEMFLYLEDRFDKMSDTEKEVYKKISSEILNSELRNADRLKREFKNKENEKL